MHPTLARLSFVIVATSALVALGVTSSGREFAWAESEGWGRRLAIREPSPVACRWGACTIRLEGDGRVLAVEVARAQVGAVVPVAVTLAENGRSHRGAGTIAFDEAGAYLAGRLEARIDGQTILGGLRVKAQ